MQGQIMDVEVELTTNHWGIFLFFQTVAGDRNKISKKKKKKKKKSPQTRSVSRTCGT